MRRDVFLALWLMSLSYIIAIRERGTGGDGDHHGLVASNSLPETCDTNQIDVEPKLTSWGQRYRHPVEKDFHSNQSPRYWDLRSRARSRWH